MTVIIEELQAEVEPRPEAGGTAETPPAAAEAPMDERKVLETVARDAWRARRLHAD
jgi:hypothetical protein